MKAIHIVAALVMFGCIGKPIPTQPVVDDPVEASLVGEWESMSVSRYYFNPDGSFAHSAELPEGGRYTWLGHFAVEPLEGGGLGLFLRVEQSQPPRGQLRYIDPHLVAFRVEVAEDGNSFTLYSEDESETYERIVG